MKSHLLIAIVASTIAWEGHFLQLRGVVDRAVEEGDRFVKLERTEWPGDLNPAFQEHVHGAMVQLRWQNGLEELKDLQNHSWAGIYQGGYPVLTRRLLVAPKIGVIYTWAGCAGYYDANYGSIVEASTTNMEVRFIIDPLNNRSGGRLGLISPVLSRRLFLVKWGANQWAISDLQLLPFCNAVNSGRRAMLEAFLRRAEGDSFRPLEAVRPSEKPNLPGAYMAFLLDEPIVARLAIIQEDARADTIPGGAEEGLRIWHATINKGLNAGLLPGMLLYFEHDRFAEWHVEVIHAASDEASIEIRREGPLLPLPPVGAGLSTAHPSADW